MLVQISGAPGAPNAVGPYSQAVRAGSLLFLSGQIPIDASTGQLISDSIHIETSRVLKNLEVVLIHSGLTKFDVIRCGVFLTSMSYFEEMNSSYEEFFCDHKPARAAVEVSALPKGARVEIDAIAFYPESS